MPNLPFLYAAEFIEVLKKKHAAKSYKEMVFLTTPTPISRFSHGFNQLGTAAINLKCEIEIEIEIKIRLLNQINRLCMWKHVRAGVYLREYCRKTWTYM